LQDVLKQNNWRSIRRKKVWSFTSEIINTSH